MDQSYLYWIKILLPSFLGAFFAFLFIRFADWLKEKHDSKKKNVRALLKIQFICNENSNAINDTIFSIDEIIRIVKESKARGQSPIAGNRLNNMILDKNVLLDLKNEDYINDCFSFNLTIVKHNDDVQAINQLHDTLKISFISNRISKENYLENINRLIDNLNEFKKFCEDSFNKNQEILAKCRIILSRENKFLRRILNIPFKKYDNDFKSDLEKEMIKLTCELKQVREKSQKEIEIIIKN